MPDRPLKATHLGTMWTVHNRGPQPLRKGEIKPLLDRGLLEPTGGRGQYGQTHYRTTPAGRDMAARLVLSEGQFRETEEPVIKGYLASEYKGPR